MVISKLNMLENPRSPKISASRKLLGTHQFIVFALLIDSPKSALYNVKNPNAISPFCEELFRKLQGVFYFETDSSATK